MSDTREKILMIALRLFARDGYEAVSVSTIAFIGSSGVGKSILINCLLGERYLDTNGLRNENRYAENTQGYLAEKRQKFKNIAKINKRNRKG